MTHINRLLDNDSIEILKSSIGKKLISFRHEEKERLYTVFIVQCDFEYESLCIESFIDVVDFYGAPEDIPKLTCYNGAYQYDKPRLYRYDIGKVIKKISIANYHVHSNNPEIEDSDYMYSFTKGIILTFEDSSQVSFERLDNFIEMIVVNEGTNLIDKLEPISEYEGEHTPPWEESSSVEIIDFE